MLEIKAAKEKVSLVSLLDTIKYKITFSRSNPNYFYPDGLTVFVGAQGQGKTLSAVNYVYKLLEMYPKAKLVTNVNLRDYPIVTYEEYFEINIDKYNDLKNYISSNNVDDIMYKWYLKDNRVFLFKDNDDLILYNNGDAGVIFFIDEIHLYMNSLESKNINMDVMTQIAQQRKQRKHIVSTCQVFGRMAKPLREQFSNVVVCKCYGGIIQVNYLIDRDSLDSDDSTGTNITGKVRKKFVWMHRPNMYHRYDTYAVIDKGKFTTNKGGIYDGVTS